MALSYAGVPLVVPTREAAEWVEAHIPAGDLFPFNEPALNQARVPVTLPGAALRRPVKVGTLYWPRGAGRWATGYFLASSSQLAQIRAAVYGGGSYTPQTLVMGDGVNQITPSLYLLSARPLEQIPGQEGGWLLTLVDQRYWWWYKSTGSLSGLGNYAAAYSTLGTALGVTVTADAVSANYAFPTALAAQYEPAAPLLDEVAFNCGQRVVVGLDGKVRAMGPVTSRQQVASNLAQGLPVLAGGRLLLYPPAVTDTPGVLPATVLLTFPKVADGSLTTTLVTLSASFSGLGLSDLPSVRTNPAATQIANSPVQASYTSGTWTNQAALQTHVNQWASDYYRWQTADVDYVFAGVAPWVPEGLSDSVEWTYTRERVTTRVQRPPLNPQSPAAGLVGGTSVVTGGGMAAALNVNIFTGSGTWNKPANLVFAEIEVIGGGGGGGGTPAGTTSTGSAGGGGGAGGYSYRKLDASSLGSTETVTVGAAGAGGTGTGGATGGGSSSFGSWCSATGGQGGAPGVVVSASQLAGVTARALSGQGSGGDLNPRTTPATPGVAIYDPYSLNIWLDPGQGGSTPYGGGGAAVSGPQNVNTNSIAGIGYGAGGSGACSGTLGAGTGGNGAPGVVIVREWTSTGSGGGGGTTSTNGQSALGANYTVTTTMAGTGLSVSLPAAGTYLLYADFAVDLTTSTANVALTAKLRDTTNSVDVTHPGNAAFCAPGANGYTTEDTRQASIQCRYVAPGACTVALWAARDPASTSGTVFADGTTARSVMGYVRLA